MRTGTALIRACCWSGIIGDRQSRAGRVGSEMSVLVFEERPLISLRQTHSRECGQANALKSNSNKLLILAALGLFGPNDVGLPRK